MIGLFALRASAWGVFNFVKADRTIHFCQYKNFGTKMTKVIAVSGINGVGKTTLIQKLELRLLAGGKSVQVFKAPAYNTVSGFKIQKFLRGEPIEEDIEELFARNREEVQRIIEQSTAEYKIIDRWLFDADCYAEYRGMTRRYHNNELIPDVQLILHADTQKIY